MQYSKFVLFTTFSIVAFVGGFFTFFWIVARTPVLKYCGFGCIPTNTLLFDSGFTFWLLVMIIGLVGLTFSYARVKYLEKNLRTNQNETTEQNN